MLATSNSTCKLNIIHDIVHVPCVHVLNYQLIYNVMTLYIHVHVRCRGTKIACEQVLRVHEHFQLANRIDELITCKGFSSLSMMLSIWEMLSLHSPVIQAVQWLKPARAIHYCDR